MPRKPKLAVVPDNAITKVERRGLELFVTLKDTERLIPLPHKSYGADIHPTLDAFGIMTGVNVTDVILSWTEADDPRTASNEVVDELTRKLDAYVGYALPETREEGVAARRLLISKVGYMDAKFAGVCACGWVVNAGDNVRTNTLLGVLECRRCANQTTTSSSTAASDDTTPPYQTIIRNPGTPIEWNFVVPADYELASDGIYQGPASTDAGHKPDVTRPLPVERRLNPLTRITHRPIVLDALAIPPDTTGVYLLLTFFDDSGARRQRWFPRRVIADTRRILELADFGYPVDSTNSNDLILYLRAALEMNGKMLPRAILMRRYGCFRIDNEWCWRFGDRTIGNKLIEVLEDDNPFTQALRPSGNEEAWLDFVRPLWCTPEYHAFRFSLAVNFAALLVRHVNGRSFIVHFWGPSKGGKTAMSTLAASAFGDPKVLCSTLNRTQISITEPYAHIDDLALLYNELQVANIDASLLIYSFTEGKGRSRARRDGGGVSREPTWQTILRTTGEQPLIGASGRDDLGGQANRVLEMEIAKGLKLEDSKRIYAFLADGHYGHAGIRFTEKLHGIVNDADQRTLLRERASDITARLKNEAGVDHERIEYIALVALTQILVDQIIFGTDEDTAYERALTDASVVVSRCVVGQDDQRTLADRALELLRDHFDSNRNQYLNVEGGLTTPNTTVVGLISADLTEVWYVSHAINRILTDKGLSPRRVWRDFANAGYIETSGKNLKVARQHGTIRKNTYHVIRIAKLMQDAL